MGDRHCARPLVTATLGLATESKKKSDGASRGLLKVFLVLWLELPKGVGVRRITRESCLRRVLINFWISIRK